MSFSKWQGSNRSRKGKSADKPVTKQVEGRNISESLEETTSSIKDLLGGSDDFIVHSFQIFGQHDAVLFYFTDITDHVVINNTILKPLKYGPPHIDVESIPLHALRDTLLEDTLYHSEGFAERNISILIDSLLRGQSVVVIDGLNEAIVIETRKISQRSIEQPATEQVIRGAREGFIESLGTNISLLRYRLQTPDFRVKSMQIGTKTKSKVAVCYMEGITNPGIVQEVYKRLSTIDIDAVLDAGYL